MQSTQYTASQITDVPAVLAIDEADAKSEVSLVTVVKVAPTPSSTELVAGEDPSAIYGQELPIKQTKRRTPRQYTFFPTDLEDVRQWYFNPTTGISWAHKDEEFEGLRRGRLMPIEDYTGNELPEIKLDPQMRHNVASLSDLPIYLTRHVRQLPMKWHGPDQHHRMMVQTTFSSTEFLPCSDFIICDLRIGNHSFPNTTIYVMRKWTGTLVLGREFLYQHMEYHYGKRLFFRSTDPAKPQPQELKLVEFINRVQRANITTLEDVLEPYHGIPRPEYVAETSVVAEPENWDEEIGAQHHGTEQ